MNLSLRVRLDLFRRDFPECSFFVAVLVVLEGLPINAEFGDIRADIRRWRVWIVDVSLGFSSFLHRRDRGLAVFSQIVRGGFIALRGLQVSGAPRSVRAMVTLAARVIHESYRTCRVPIFLPSFRVCERGGEMTITGS